MSKSKRQGTTNRNKAFIVASITSALIMLNVIPFTYSHTIQCGTNNSGNYATKSIKQEVTRVGIPFAYWWQNSAECEGGLAMDTNLTHASGTALFWNLGIIGLITVGLSLLVNPTTRRMAT